MALDLMNLFKNIKWAKNGDITDMSQTNYEVGWAHLGDDTPTVEDFNLIQQLNDRKDQWLFAQVESVLKAKSINPTEVDLNALVRAVKLIAAGYSTPLAISSMSTNNSTELGHTHQIDKASLTQQGIVQLNSATNSDNETMAATPKAVKIVKDLIDALTRNLGNYIPNSKKSPAVNSDSADTVATSAAVKIAYDKGVEAKTAADGAQRTANDGVAKAKTAQAAAEAAQRTANDGVSKATTAQTTANSAVTKADNAQRAADNANNNANNRVPKTGDTTIVGALRA